MAGFRRVARMMSDRTRLGVVIVAFNSAPIIVECLESLLASEGAAVSVVVVDNNSDDETVEVVRAWASGQKPFEAGAECPVRIAPAPKPVALDVRGEDEGDPVAAQVTLILSRCNRGFAGAVNLGLRTLMASPDVGPVWVLNPDCVVSANVARRYLETAAEARFGLLTSRTVFYGQPTAIQTDGGVVNRWTGACMSINQGGPADATPAPDTGALSFMAGCNMVASREFLDRVGLMDESYFLYYEEVDWAMRRGDLPLVYVPGAVVYHHGGTTIGTGSLVRRPSPFANYFNYRNRMWFARRFMPGRQAFVLAFGLAKALQLALRGAFDESAAVLAGLLGGRAPAGVVDRIKDPQARRLAFGRAE